MPHGLSNAMLLPAVKRFSIPAAEQRYADCARAIRAAAPEDATVACEKLVRELARVNVVMQVPTPESFGIPRDAYSALCETMAEQAIASGSPADNTRISDKAEMVAIYRAVWDRH